MLERKYSFVVKQYSTRAEMGAEAAKEAAAVIRELLAKKDEINMIFAAAPSQNEFLAALIKEEGVDFTRINAYHMDEYVGLNDDAPQRFGNFLKDHIFGLVPFKSVNYIKGNAEEIDAECFANIESEHFPGAEKTYAIISWYRAEEIQKRIGSAELPKVLESSYNAFENSGKR